MNKQSMKSNNMLYPWQEEKWLDFLAYHKNQRIPHAMLLHGVGGIGKLNLAICFAKFLLCQENKHCDLPCEKCKSCILFNANNHPDYFLIQAEEAGKNIKVEQIRNVIHEVDNTSHQGGNRIIIIKDADSMNKASANALLKTLEEPTSNSIIILVTENLSLLLPTIRSRCQKITFYAPQTSESLNWLQRQNLNFNHEQLLLSLKFTENAPLKALEILQQDMLSLCSNIIKELAHSLQDKQLILNASNFANKYSDFDIKIVVKIFWYIIQDVYKVRQNIATEFLLFTLFYQEITFISKHLPNNMILDKYLDYLLQTQNILNSNIAINKNLLLENLWMRLQGCSGYSKVLLH